MISPELMDHVKFPCDCKEVVFHRWYFYDVKSILDKGLIAGGRDKKKWKTDNFLHIAQSFW